jgi:hypothetical protein
MLGILSTNWPHEGQVQPYNDIVSRRPTHCESDSRQKRKYLPFRKLQPPRDFEGFPVPSYSLPSRIRRVQLFFGHLLAIWTVTYWPFGLTINNVRIMLSISFDFYLAKNQRPRHDGVWLSLPPGLTSLGNFLKYSTSEQASSTVCLIRPSCRAPPA